MSQSRLILASASPRRAQLLRQLGLEFEIIVPECDELCPAGVAPQEIVLQNASQKALQVAAAVNNGVVIGADTVVWLEYAMGKPEDAADAKRMLAELSGKTHVVYTGVAVIDAEHKRSHSRYLATEVTFLPLSPQTIDRYVATGEPLDKAGAYGIQGKGELLVESIRGCYTNVVGLPLPLLAEMLAECGIPVWGSVGFSSTG